MSTISKFVPSKSGFDDLRNEGFIQKVCLAKAKDVAAIAQRNTGKPFQCDVQPGRTRCHARASCYMHAALNRREWYGGGWSNVADGTAAAAEAVGGKRTWKPSAKHKARFKKKGK